ASIVVVENGKIVEVWAGDSKVGEPIDAMAEPDKTFSRTGRFVHNRIHAKFVFRDGKIIRHKDSFDFWRWASQALGPVGLLLGWTPMIKSKVRSTARGSLTKFMNQTA
ncbi:MAG: hypothetical protein L0Y35_06375, partial [Flammeovirgaceae bacterium]|nr:hypothetical protein [Flammeovirgaceae bacterium]